MTRVDAAGRRLARASALQMLYQAEVGRMGPQEAIGAFWRLDRSGEESAETIADEANEAAEEPITDDLREFANDLVRETLARVEAIDQLLVVHAHNWRLERMAVIDRLVLRLAVCELLTHPETPPKVVINEALELARTFSGDEAVAFVNGVLDAVRKALPAGGGESGEQRGRPAAHERLPNNMSESKESDQVAQRRANFEALQRLGVNPYPHAFERTHSVRELVSAYSARTGDELAAERVETKTAGRILAIRSFGKANFIAISDGESLVQAYIRQDSVSERDFQIFKLLDFGDFIGVEGYLFRTRTNELTIHVSKLEFLVKCFLPLPEKWHGLSDIEIRYRQRYLDLIVNPDSRRVFEVRSRVLANLRGFLNARGYLEVETPMMQPIPGRRARPALRDAPQHARHAALSPHCARALPQAAHGRRHRTGVRDQP